MLTLLGVAVVVLGFAARFNPLLVVVVAALVTGLCAGLSPIQVLETLGHAFNENRFVTVALLVLPVIGVAERAGLQERAKMLIARFRGVSVDTLFEAAEPLDAYAMAHSYGGYTTNLAIEDLTEGKAWVVTEHEGEPLPRQHGGPARLLVPHLYFWKSAKWLAGLRVMDHDEPGFWEANGYNNHGDPWKEERYWTD